jgi:hypothetical protein
MLGILENRGVTSVSCDFSRIMTIINDMSRDTLFRVEVESILLKVIDLHKDRDNKNILAEDHGLMNYLVSTLIQGKGGLSFNLRF